jgi:hypothetical protein
MSSEPAGAMLAHSVYFSLHDASDQAKGRLTAACKQCLAHHPGVVFFAVGTRAEDFAWPVSDLGFDVALHLVFRGKADHDRYQESLEHVRFLEENEANWKAVRAFDAYVQPIIKES